MPETKLMDIEEMIVNENDPEKRAMLVALHSINLCAINTSDKLLRTIDNIELLDKDYINHKKEYEAAKNTQKGMWQVLSALFGICQVLIIWYVKDTKDNIKEVQALLQAEQTSLIQLRNFDSNIEKEFAEYKRLHP